MVDRPPKTLACQPTESGLAFRVGDPPIPVEEWTARTDVPSGLGVLIRLRDEGVAVERDAAELLVQWTGVAGLTVDELRYLGLPDHAPLALEVVANGGDSRPRFRGGLWLCARRASRAGSGTKRRLGYALRARISCCQNRCTRSLRP